MRAVEVGVVRADAGSAIVAATLAVEMESDPAVAGYVVARTVLGSMLSFVGRSAEVVPILDDAGGRARTACRWLIVSPTLGAYRQVVHQPGRRALRAHP